MVLILFNKKGLLYYQINHNLTGLLGAKKYLTKDLAAFYQFFVHLKNKNQCL